MYAPCHTGRNIVRTAVITVVLTMFSLFPIHAQNPDSQQLGMAIDYFQSGKYHEAMLLLQKLNTKYRLNPRFKAYLGVCHYYEWHYAEAAQLLDSVIPQLTAFAPQERSFYCYAAAESHFELQQYDRALPLYEQMLTLCKDNEKADAYYRMGFIYMYREAWIPALDAFQSALVYYRQQHDRQAARIAQIKNMINGCCRKIDETQS